MLKYGAVVDKIRSLRSTGATYGEILEAVGLRIPKSTLSYLCRDVVLPPEYQAKIEKLNTASAARGRQIAFIATHLKRQRYLTYLRERNVPLIKKIAGEQDALKVALAMFYLGEGAKWNSHAGLQLGSSDPQIIQTYLKLLSICYDVNSTRLRCRILYRADQNLKKLEAFWSRVAGVPLQNFYKTKPDPRTVGKPTRRTNYKGVCVIYCTGATGIQLELGIITDLLLRHLGR